MEIVKSYVQKMPAFRFIGKCYGDEDRVDGGFGAQWGECFGTDFFGSIERAVTGESIGEDSDAFIGLMRCKEGEPFVYAIGMFVPADTQAPEGMTAIDFPASTFGICWLHGFESELYCHEPDAAARLGEEGHMIVNDEKGACWFFERYACPRFTTPDAEGKVILDIGFFIEE